MLRKLIKHELLATSRVMLPMLLLVLLAAVGGNVSTYRLLETDNALFSTIGVLLLIVFFVSIFAACLLAFALMIQRFYQNLLKDEGYLMMTLPATVHEHVISKLLVSILWFAATALTVLLSLFILIYQAEPAVRFMQEVGEFLRTSALSSDALHAAAICLELLVLVILWGASVCLQFYAAMAVGHSFSGHKLALSCAAYFAMQFAMQIISVMFAMLMVRLNLNETLNLWLQGVSAVTTIHLTMLFLMGLALVYGAVHYAITAYFLKNRLNLS